MLVFTRGTFAAPAFPGLCLSLICPLADPRLAIERMLFLTMNCVRLLRDTGGRISRDLPTVLQHMGRFEAGQVSGAGLKLQSGDHFLRTRCAAKFGEYFCIMSTRLVNITICCGVSMRHGKRVFCRR